MAVVTGPGREAAWEACGGQGVEPKVLPWLRLREGFYAEEKPWPGMWMSSVLSAYSDALAGLLFAAPREMEPEDPRWYEGIR